jgi:hypothetical protein
MAGRLADVPLDGVQPVGAVGDVGGGDVLGAGQEVREPDRDQRAERDLERAAGDVDVRVAARGGVQIDPVGADPDGVGVLDRAVLAADGVGDVLLDDGVLALDAP